MTFSQKQQLKYHHVVGHCLKFCKKAKACIQNSAYESASHSMVKPWVDSQKKACLCGSRKSEGQKKTSYREVQGRFLTIDRGCEKVPFSRI